MVENLIPIDDITSEIVARVLNDAGIQATSPVPEVVMVPGPGSIGITGFGVLPHLSFSCVFRFRTALDLESRQVLANQLMRVVPGFRAYVNDEGKVVCTLDLMVEAGLLPTQLVYTCNAFRVAMEKVAATCEGVLS